MPNNPEVPAPALLPTRLPLPSHVPPSQPPPGAEPVVGPQQGPAGPPKSEIPTSGTGLTELAQEQYNLSVTAAASLGYTILSIKGDAKHDVLVYQVARYKDIADAQGNTYRFGIAVEATIIANVDHFQGGLTLPVVAANVELGYSSASSDLALRGYAFSKENAVTLPAWGSFDVDTYADFQKAVDAIVAKVLFDNANIKPVLLAASTSPANSDDGTTPEHRFFYRLTGPFHHLLDKA